jgi:hydrogenase-4 component F
MTSVFTFLLPAAAVVPVRLTPRRWAGAILVLVAFVDVILSFVTVSRQAGATRADYFLDHYFVLDPTSLLFLLLINVVFFGIAVYMLSRVQNERSLEDQMPEVAGLSLIFMATMNMAVLSNHLILMWAFIEATTMVAALLVAKGDAGASQAAFRYFLYSTISLSLSFVGFLCLAYSAHQRHVDLSFFVDRTALGVTAQRDVWQRLGFALVLFGFGSKLGLAPLYGWLPAAYDSAPPSVSAMLAAVQFNASIVAIFRIFQIRRSGAGGFVAQEMIVMGALSLVVAAVQIMATRNYKRLIAYACVSSSGVIAIGLGVGRAAAYGVVLYVVSNAFVKTILFLTAGRLKAIYGTKDVAALSGVIKRFPYSGLFFMVGTFALLGFPPFGSFMAELLILSGMVQTGHFLVFTLLCVALTVVFVATGRSIFPMLWGDPGTDRRPRESLLTATPKLAFVAALVSLGIYTPEPATKMMQLVAASLGGR